ncbi:MAG: molybdopterin-synthase adenylyltransferase MoeB [Solirubrobacteraceae bacterium]|nr:molybdopterin-synthase adenylyltransferase MoeB [Solirubrobacteraceae bacterium]
MTPSGAEFVRQIKGQVDEVDPAQVQEVLWDPDTVIVDVRESDEVSAGKLPGAVHVARGFLESRIDGAVGDRDKRVILYCASGNRSALAARTLKEDLGYDRVESMTGGYTLWKDRGYEVDVPRVLTPSQRERYSRHLLINEIGLEGQLKLIDAKVLLIGAGALGSPNSLYLAAAGVGTLGIVDDDVVDLSNLQRQVAHGTSTIGEPKTESVARRLEDLNPEVKVVQHRTRLDASTVLDIFRDYDVIVDGTDNFPTRYLINDAAVRLGKPVVSAAILGFEAQLSVFDTRRDQEHEPGPCYRCLFPEPPPAELAPSCGANGVLGVLPGTAGLLQATEVIKLVVGVGDPLRGRLAMYDALAAEMREVKVRRDPSCPVCSVDPASIPDDELGVFPDYEAFCAAAG